MYFSGNSLLFINSFFLLEHISYPFRHLHLNVLVTIAVEIQQQLSYIFYKYMKKRVAKKTNEEEEEEEEYKKKI